MTAALLLHRADGAARSTAFRKAAFGPADPCAHERETAWEGPGGMAAGRVAFGGAVEVARYPHTEVLVVVEGELVLEPVGAAPCLLQRGQGAVIARGTALRMWAQPRALCVFCAAASERADPGVRPLRADGGLQPSNPPAAELLLGPSPQCRSDNVFSDTIAGLLAGTWDSTPYHRIVRPHRVNEFMYLLDGAVRLASPDGHVLQAQAGDAVFVPQGAPIGWESRERVAKFYVVQDVKP